MDLCRLWSWGRLSLYLIYCTVMCMAFRHKAQSVRKSRSGQAESRRLLSQQSLNVPQNIQLYIWLHTKLQFYWLNVLLDSILITTSNFCFLSTHDPQNQVERLRVLVLSKVSSSFTPSYGIFTGFLLNDVWGDLCRICLVLFDYVEVTFPEWHQFKFILGHVKWAGLSVPPFCMSGRGLVSLIFHLRLQGLSKMSFCKFNRLIINDFGIRFLGHFYSSV